MKGGCAVRIVDYSEYKNEDQRSLAIALGLFDGVHRGHRELIRLAAEVAKAKDLTPAVFTFRDGTGLKSEAKRIYPEDEKHKILSSLGIELLIEADFSEICNMTKDEFIREALVERFSASVAIAGADFRFGRGAEGNAEYLMAEAKWRGIEAIIVDMQSYTDEFGRRCEISSSAIRALLECGKVREAGELLGEAYHLSGTVERGRGVGKTLGYPTVNISLPKSSPLASGVYETRVEIDGKLYTGLTNVGVCPTFAPREKHTETYILDYEGDAYFENIRLDFIERVREERRFDTAEELGAEIAKNIETVLGDKQ